MREKISRLLDGLAGFGAGVAAHDAVVQSGYSEIIDKRIHGWWVGLLIFGGALAARWLADEYEYDYE